MFVLVDIFYLPNSGCFDKTGVFQQPQALALIEGWTAPGSMSDIGMLRQALKAIRYNGGRDNHADVGIHKFAGF